jgi:hypothetical protein
MLGIPDLSVDRSINKKILCKYQQLHGRPEKEKVAAVLKRASAIHHANTSGAI